MEATQTLEQWFKQADASLPVLTESARLAVVVVGVLLWLAGGKLLKAACVFGGLALGMILGGLTFAFVDSAAVGVGFMFGLGILGMLGAWLMFRAWVAMAAALIFAVAAPATVMVYQGVPVSQLSKDTQVATKQLETRYNVMSSELNEQARLEVQSLISQGDYASLTQADELLKEQGMKALDSARGVLFRNIEDMGGWWKDNTTTTQRTIGLAMLIGAGVGFMLGFVMPNHAAAVQSAIVGAVMIVIPGRELLLSHVPASEGLIPTTARGTLIILGLITVVGLALQWTLYLRRDDKKA